MDECVICSAPVDEEEAPLLEMGGFGNPKYLFVCTKGGQKWTIHILSIC